MVVRALCPGIEVSEIAATHLSEVRRKLDQLRELEASLDGFVGSCDMACAGGAGRRLQHP